ncbi:MAG: hypothetical protein QOI71_2550 [Gaiellales bacterium]|jgi:hypothetical protein|nr:hypothetical protein [Gaiellales bacterium]
MPGEMLCRLPPGWRTGFAPAAIALPCAACSSVKRVRKLRLAPGRYVLFCTMPGPYLGGMRTDLSVRG